MSTQHSADCASTWGLSIMIWHRKSPRRRVAYQPAIGAAQLLVFLWHIFHCILFVLYILIKWVQVFSVRSFLMLTTKFKFNVSYDADSLHMYNVRSYIMQYIKKSNIICHHLVIWLRWCSFKFVQPVIFWVMIWSHNCLRPYKVNGNMIYSWLIRRSKLTDQKYCY